MRLLQNQRFSISVKGNLALTGVLPAAPSISYCRGAFASKSMLFHKFYKYFFAFLGGVPATASIAYCWGALASKSMLFHKFYKHFGSCGGGAACDPVHRILLGRVCLKSMFLHKFYKYFGSHWRCCLRPRPSPIAGVRLLQNQCFSINFTNILTLTGGAACDPVHRILLG